MIDFLVRVQRISRERLPDRSIAHVAIVHIDGALQANSLRLTAEVFDRLDAAHAAGRHLVMTLSIAAPEQDGVA